MTLEGTADLIAGMKALDDERERYLTRWAYYAGSLPERFSSAAIAQLMDQATPDTQYRFRFAKVPINVMRNRVQIASISGSSDALSTQIEQIRQANDLDMIEPFLHERAFTYGDAYMICWPADPEDESLPADLRDAGVEMRYQSPLSTRAMYDAEDGLRLRYVIRRWKERDPLGPWRWKAELWYPGGYYEPWVCQDGAAGLDPVQWRPDADDLEAWPIEHEYGMPIKHARNALPYGRPEHADAMGPQDALTKAIMTQVVVELEAHGLPERWEMIKANNPDMARDAVPWTDNANAPAAKEPTPRARRGPGTRHVLEGRDATGEYHTPNPSDLVPAMSQWLQMYSTVTETPPYEYDPTIAAGMTGIARMWADRPLDAREKNAKRFLARFWTEVWDAALSMVGVAESARKVEIEWAAPGVINDPDWWAVANIRREHGVPQDVILREANYPPDEVKKWLDDQDDEARSLLERVTMLEKLGTALQSIGSAVALGAIDQTRVDSIVRKLFGEQVISDEPAEPPAPVVPVPALPGQQPEIEAQ